MPKTFTPAIDCTHLPRPQVALTGIVSRKFSHLGYCPERQELAVLFKPDAPHTYHYPDFTQDDHDKLMSAESLGTHFGLHIASRTSHKYPSDKPERVGEMNREDPDHGEDEEVAA